MVGHERIDERIHVEEAQHREERPGEKQAAPPAGRATAAADATSTTNSDQRRRRKQVLPPHGLADLPARVDEGQVYRPEELAQVEPDRPARDQATARPGVRSNSGPRRRSIAFHPGGEHAGRPRRATKKARSGSTSRFHDNRPRCHQKITSSAAGSVAGDGLAQQGQHEQRPTPASTTAPSASGRSAGRPAWRPGRTRPKGCSSAP